ncbi:MAG: hypothetical protein GX800_07765 [Clostridiaceae bacterium]|nr:hypothetical protein [Clostridiaceae bacterium]
MKKSRVIILALAVILTTVFLGGCNNREATVTDDEKIIFSAGYVGADNTKWKQDAYYQYISDKLNIEIDFRALHQGNSGEKARIRISSGDMPDVLNSDLNFTEYLEYGAQGLVKPLPSDYAAKYPNMSFAIEMTGAMDKLRAVADGKIYGLLRPMDHYTQYIDAFKEAYKNGENLREKMDEYPYIDKYGFAFRKDWAKKLGIKTSKIMEYDDFVAMVKAFKESDLGSVGQDNAIGIAVDYTEAPNIFVTMHNPRYNYFHKVDGKYVCGFLEDSTKDGVLAYAQAYRDGLLSPSFYAQKSQDLNALFCSQKAGVVFPRAEYSGLRKLKSDFKKANPNLVLEDCIDVCWIKSPKGKIAGRVANNFNKILYFNPDLKDDVFAKILSVADYVASPEGAPQISLGVLEVDYREENGKYIVLREKNESGEYPPLYEKYPSSRFFNDFVKTLFYFSEPADKHARALTDELVAEKLAGDTDLLEMDINRDCFTSDRYAKFLAANDVNTMIAETIVSNGDIEKLWNEKVNSFRAEAEVIEREMNEEIGG